MNKKQLIVAWGIGIVISGVFIYQFNYFSYRYIPQAFMRSIGFSIPVLIIGGLLIYTLRDKKK